MSRVDFADVIVVERRLPRAGDLYLDPHDETRVICCVADHYPDDGEKAVLGLPHLVAWVKAELAGAVETVEAFDRMADQLDPAYGVEETEAHHEAVGRAAAFRDVLATITGAAGVTRLVSRQWSRGWTRASDATSPPFFWCLLCNHRAFFSPEAAEEHRRLHPREDVLLDGRGRESVGLDGVG